MLKLHKSSPVILFCVAVLIAAIFLFGKNERKEKQQNDQDPAELVAYKWYTPPVPDEMTFAGEKVPLDERVIREQFERELIHNFYWQGNILYILKLSQRYFPMIEEKLAQHGVPEDMKYLCVAESNLQNLVSKAGAAGFWQFMRGTAPAYGLEVNSDVDERYHVEKSTDAACKYLKQAYAKFGSWTAAAASYNCGQGGYRGNATFQRTSNYYDLLLPEETNRYIFRILTFKYLLGTAEKLGFMMPAGKGYQPVELRKVTITKTIPNLATFAIEEGTTYKLLKVYNPWLRSRKLYVRPGRSYDVYLPPN